MTHQFLVPLDPSLFALDIEERGFLKAMIGLDNDVDLKAYILAIQKQAYEVSCPPTSPLT